ncbi:MAG TPA: cytochrome c maturation protein CcmE [Xanthobacteraceae bacterium]|nr:cytochrome c maturation protein CcmE [Xanthobacteraceae bacterium]
MTRKQRRLTLIAIAGLVLAGAAVLTLSALRDSITFFASPSELALNPPPPGKRLRIGGLVKEGSVVKEGVRVRFDVTDGEKSIPVRYEGMLPDLFREKQGVVADGVLEDGVFIARTILAKHDEYYMPREVVDALKDKGVWKHNEAPKQ